MLDTEPNDETAEQDKNDFNDHTNHAFGRQHNDGLGDALDTNLLERHRSFRAILGVAREFRDFVRDVLALDHFAENGVAIASHGVGATVMKNWLPLVLGPELAMDSLPVVECFSEGWNSSANV